MRVWLTTGSIAKSLVSLSMVFGFGCLPKENPLTQASEAPGRGYAGFNGLVTAQTVGPTRVRLTWESATDPSVVAYNVYDATSLFNPRLIRTVPVPATEVTLSGLSNQSFYTFRVRAANRLKEEDTNVRDISAIPYAGILPNAQVQSSSSAIVQFADASNADQINIYCRRPPATEWLMTQEVRNNTLTQVLLEDLSPGVTYQCRAALMINGFVDNNLATTTFMPMGQASQLEFTAQPGSAGAGVPLATQPIITIKDANGNIVSAGPDSTAIVTLSVAPSSPTQGTLRGTASVAAVAGVARFTGLNLQEAGAKIIVASKADTAGQTMGSPTITQNSNQFTISAGTVSPTQSSLTITPSVPPDPALTANGSSAYTVTFTLRDEFGNPVVGVRPTFTSNISGDTLTQPAQNTNAQGVVTGTIASTIADTTPARSISINSPAGLSSVTRLVPFVPGAASRLAFFTQPVNSPAGANGMAPVRVAVQDAQGNTVTTGPSSVIPISLSLVGSPNLTGTLTANAINGIATFNDLGVSSTQNGYRLQATFLDGAGISPAFSNTFNITAGFPQRIGISGPTTFLSGACSPAVTIQLRDAGNNPANAIQSTPIQLGGLGNAQVFTSASCGGSPLNSPVAVTFTPGSNSRTVYLRSQRAEAITLTASDPAVVLTQGTLGISIAPSKISLSAVAQPPAAPGTPLSVPAGRCSTAITVTTLGENNSPGPNFVNTPITISGLTGSQAALFSDSNCTAQLDLNNLVLMPSVGTQYSTNFYIKGDRAENLTLGLTELNGIMTTVSALQSVTIGASDLTFTGPSTVVSGLCSSAFTVTLRDRLGNAVVSPSNRTLALNGLAPNSTGAFYVSSSCTGTELRSSIVIPQNASAVQLYFRDTGAANYSLFVSDPQGLLSVSPTRSLSISPSSLRVTGPVAGSSATTVCAGPFTVNTLSGSNNITAAVAPLTINLSGGGDAGAFFSDAACATSITSLTFSEGVSARTFYFRGQFPETSLSLTASDAGAVVQSGSLPWTVTGAPGFIGTNGTTTDANGNLFWFDSGFTPVRARVNGVAGATDFAFDSTKQFLYVADASMARVLKYDYTNRTFVGWIGAIDSNGSVGVTGSTLGPAANAACVNTPAWGTLPGWCIGGLPRGDSAGTGIGRMWNPWSVATDDQYVYVANLNADAVQRWNATTGAFAGWIGRATSAVTGPADGGPGTCTGWTSGPVPGWCIGGNADSFVRDGDGSVPEPRVVRVSGGFLYVGVNGAILRFDAATGAFAGWIGVSNGGVITGGAAGAPPGCESITVGQLTPGWCLGGNFVPQGPRTALPNSATGGGINTPEGLEIVGNNLYIMHSDNGGTINEYNLTTGAFIRRLPGLSNNWQGARRITYDSVRDEFYVADFSRIARVDRNGSVTGWVGKVNNANSMSAGEGGPAGCATLATNMNTPGWCLGGTARAGMDEPAYHDVRAVALDGDGRIIAGQGPNFPTIKQVDKLSGAYLGQMAMRSTSPSQWTNDSVTVAGLNGFDDQSMSGPSGSFVSGDFLYLVEEASSVIKRFNRKTGSLTGWVGGITTVPTAGGASCTSANPFGPSPAWCLGALFQPNYMFDGSNMITANTPGVLRNPVSITGDGTHLYVVDRGRHAIHKYIMSTGAYVGWIGRINTTPVGGDPGCNNPAIAAPNSFTPGWCIGGSSREGSGDGHMWNPTAITTTGGNLYVIDSVNHRVVSFSASSGAFNGWIGRIGGSAPTSGCTPNTFVNGQNVINQVSATGWCRGGTAQASSAGDRGGGFNFWGGNSGAIATDGTKLYIGNFWNYRVDRYSLNGDFEAASRTHWTDYTGAWTNNPATLATWRDYGTRLVPASIHIDGTHIYGYGYGDWNNWDGIAIWKMDKTTGTMVGWRGGIQAVSGGSPTAGDPGCAGAVTVTPGWCQGGRSVFGLRMGMFRGWGHISGDSHYVYVGDPDTNRLTRLPK
jgi:hypothetical protein